MKKSIFKIAAIAAMAIIIFAACNPEPEKTLNGTSWRCNMHSLDVDWSLTFTKDFAIFTDNDYPQEGNQQLSYRYHSASEIVTIYMKNSSGYDKVFLEGKVYPYSMTLTHFDGDKLIFNKIN